MRKNIQDSPRLVARRTLRHDTFTAALTYISRRLFEEVIVILGDVSIWLAGLHPRLRSKISNNLTGALTWSRGLIYL